jgi:hypothetical protein
LSNLLGLTVENPSLMIGIIVSETMRFFKKKL